MRNNLKKKHDELIEIPKKQDETILQLIKQGHKDIIILTVTDYLSSLE